MADYFEPDFEGAEDTQSGRFLTFVIGRETYGIEIRCVTEIIGIQKFAEVPELPSYIKGIINLRGKIIPVMDVRLRFGKEPMEYTDRTCVIVVELPDSSVGLIVDRVSEVLSIPEQDIEELPYITGQLSSCIKNIGKQGGKIVLILDTEKLLSPDELAGIEEQLENKAE